ncbi:hypothetical protein Bca4012_098083 [Brassica carinata]|uniref:Bromo domain-containing protein n=3 Tax=Brassica TaxID=3705 RepID=A0A0D3CPZ5_BRAOL|nr:unnamed protein product [Brassica napus]CDY49818.1 BnaC06g04510D [Brassica napus]VDD60313.1 unnamed protein product [Brassica oleracea]
MKVKFSPVRNNDRRGRNVRSRYVSDFEMNGADYAPQPNDAKKERDKVRKIEYRNHEQFRHDVWQIQLNAHLYNNNGRNPGIPPLADQLLEICDCLLEDYGDQLAEAEKGIDR